MLWTDMTRKMRSQARKDIEKCCALGKRYSVRAVDNYTVEARAEGETEPLISYNFKQMYHTIYYMSAYFDELEVFRNARFLKFCRSADKKTLTVHPAESPKKVFAVDFDGFLFEEAFPEIGKPILQNIVICKRIRKAGHTLILWSCRADDKLKEAVEACAKYDLFFDYVNENTPENIEKYGNDSRKICADYYFDDRNIDPKVIYDAI